MPISIRTKLLFAMLIAALIPLILVAAVSFFKAEKIIFDNQLARLELINTSKVNRVSQIINNIFRKLKEIQTDPTVLKEIEVIEKYKNKRTSQEYQTARKNLDSVLQNMQRASQFEDIYLVDLDGHVVYASDTGHAWQYLGKPISPELEWSKPLSQYGPSYTSVFLNTIKSGNYDFFVQAPLYDEDGKIYGKAVIEVPLLPIYNTIESQIGLGKTGETILVEVKNKDMALILSPLRYNKFSVLTMHPFNLASSDNKIEFIDYMNQKSIGVYKKIPKINFTLLTMINKEEMFSIIYGLRYENALIVIGATVLVVLAALWLSYSITRPLQELAKVARGLKEKNFDVQIDENLTSSQDEIGMLARAFERMIYELKNYYQSLQNVIWQVQRSKEEALSANKAKSMFLANVSHELRTPLNAVIGYSELLTDEAEDLHLKSFVSDLRNIRSSAKQLLDLINNILDLSKIEIGKTELYLETIKIAPFVEAISDLIRPTFEKGDNIFEVEISDHIGEMTTDATRVRQCLQNLLSNAAKFTKNGIVRLFVNRDEEWVYFVISDTGIGITDQQLERLFQPFTQAEGATTKKYGGTGLGLYLAKTYCEMLGGELKVESVYGKGSTFTMKLPGKGQI